MTSHFFRIFSVVFLLAVSTAWAAKSVPGIEVVVLNGSTIVFRGVTDGRGRFETGPLPPGIYTVEVRTMPNTPPTSARFFLSLAGAKPLGEATMRPGVALAMNASVRNPAGMKGQVTARGGIVYIPARGTAQNNNPGSAPTSPTSVNPPRPRTAPTPPGARSMGPLVANTPVASSAKPGTAPAPSAGATGPNSPLVRRPAGYQPKIINGRRHFWRPITSGSNLGRWLPESVARR